MLRPLCFTFLFLAAAPAWAAPEPALAMLGQPKYGPAFPHFDYVNPDAPKGGEMKNGVVGTFDSLNPFLIRGKAPQGLDTGVFSLVYQSLMARSWDEPFSLYGLIAESVDVPEDRSSITFRLRPSARWQDGQKITADDVLFSFETLRDHGRPTHRTYYKRVEKTEICGELCVRFTFKPNADGSRDREMPLIMGLMPVLPRHDFADRPFDQTTLRPPVGSGPYQIAAVDPGRSITYRRDPAYWGQNLPSQKGLYNFDTIRMDYYRDESVALQAFEAGAFDMRREADENKWVKAYDTAAHQGMERQDFAHRRPEPARGFVLNLRRPLWQDLTLRRAVALAFDDAWINRSFFQGRLHRSKSFFANSPLASDSEHAPQGLEKALLERHAALLPQGVASAPVAPPSTESGSGLRDHLLQAAALLKQAGYTLANGKLLTPQGSPVTFEILLSDPFEEKIALNWARALTRLGIEARVRTADSAQYQARLTSFDYDVTIARWINTLSPGNEQSAYWGSQAADQKGSRNYAGLRNQAIDDLARSIPASRSQEELEATTHALDRALLSEAFWIPFFYVGADHIAFWSNRVQAPKAAPLYGTVIESWFAPDPPKK